jgi:hypothetical protein
VIMSRMDTEQATVSAGKVETRMQTPGEIQNVIDERQKKLLATSGNNKKHISKESITITLSGPNLWI